MHIVISCIEARDEFCLSCVRSKAIEGEGRGTVATQGGRMDIKVKEDEGEISVNSLLSFYSMPISELAKKSCGLNFDIAAEEMRRLKTSPSEEEWTILYGLYMQVLHGDTPNEDIYPPPTEGKDVGRYTAWKGRKGMRREEAKNEYVKMAEKMIEKYERSIVRSKWNSQVWTVDY